MASAGATYPMTEPSPTTTPATSAKSSSPRVVLCPYCGAITPKTARCGRCRGLLDPLSRQATQNAMGPWFVRDVNNPHRPGCSYHTLKDMASKGRLHPETILRGPATNQFWSLAKRTPGVSHLVGLCYACQEEVEPTDEICRFCGVSFEIEADRQHLGLAPVHLLPGQAPAEAIAESSDVLSPSPSDIPTDSSAATIGKVPGSEVAVLDDTDRLVRRLASKIKRQRIVTVLMLLIALAALAAVGALVAEARGFIPKTLTPWLLTPSAADPTRPAIPASPAHPANPLPHAQPAPAEAPAAEPAPSDAAPAPASPAPAAVARPEPAVLPAQNPADQTLASIRELIAKDTQASLQNALTQLADLKKQQPSFAEACRNLERLATQRLEQLRLKRLP